MFSPCGWLRAALLSLALDLVAANQGKTFYIHWNTTNSIFRIDNTDHVFDLNKGNAQFEFDQVNILCPVYAPDVEGEHEKYIIYNVSKEEYDTCRITNPNPRIIAICDKPHKLMFFTITFRPFSPQPGGLEFLPGKDYYFISTSSKDDLHRRIGGWCSSHNMKLVFRVCCRPDEAPKPPPFLSQPPQITSNPAVQTARPQRPPLTTPPPSPSITTAATPRPHVKATAKKTQHKDKGVGDKSPNEVVKSEELSHSSVGPASTSLVVLAAAALAALLLQR